MRWQDGHRSGQLPRGCGMLGLLRTVRSVEPSPGGHSEREREEPASSLAKTVWCNGDVETTRLGFGQAMPPLGDLGQAVTFSGT